MDENLEHPESARRKIKVGRIVQILTDLIEAPETEPTVRVQASKLLLDKSLASLSSLDITMNREDELTDQSNVKAKLAMLIEKAGPALLSEILGERAKQLPVTIEQKPTEVGDDSTVDPQKQRSTG